jgi:lipoate-protein ligase A
MSKEWRLLLTGSRDAASNMAIDEAILSGCGQEGEGAPAGAGTIRLYQWTPPAVSIGYFQGMRDEVDVAKCEAKDIEVVRRITGGGAVYHDAEVTYSLIANEKNESIPNNIMESYGLICNGLVLALKEYGMDAAFRGINDVCVGEKKISGSAQTRRYGGVLQHGTLLYDVDVPLMFDLLLVPNEKIKDKMIKAVEERVTSVKHQAGEVEVKELMEALARGFEAALGIKLAPGELTPQEIELAGKIREERYANPEWNFKR